MQRLFQRYRLVVLERGLQSQVGGGSTALPVEWKLATEEDISGLPEAGLNYNEGRKKFARQMLKDGDVCLLGMVGDKHATVGWVSFRRLFTHPVSIPLGEGWAYFNRTRTAPEFRGKGLQKAGIRRRIEIAAQMGKLRAVNVVDSDNAISLHNYQAMGFQERHCASVLRFFDRWEMPRVPQGLVARLSSDAAGTDRP